MLLSETVGITHRARTSPTIAPPGVSASDFSATTVLLIMRMSVHAASLENTTIETTESTLGDHLTFTYFH